AVTLELVAELDDSMVAPPPVRITLEAAGRDASAIHELRLEPRRRGELAVRAVHLRWTGPLGLIERKAAVPIDRTVAVVPNLGAVRAVALRMFADRNFMAGLKVERYLGDGSEFESLHEYVPGLDHRA